MVTFPPGWNAPSQVTFERLQSWPENSDPGIKYFSGTATYSKEFQVPEDLPAANRELWLDLGMVKDFAEVSLNGKPFGTLWKPPFRVNVSAALKRQCQRPALDDKPPDAPERLDDLPDQPHLAGHHHHYQLGRLFPPETVTRGKL